MWHKEEVIEYKQEAYVYKKERDFYLKLLERMKVRIPVVKTNLKHWRHVRTHRMFNKLSWTIWLKVDDKHEHSPAAKGSPRHTEDVPQNQQQQ